MEQHQDGCIFCQIARGLSPCHLIKENRLFMAFLDIFPNTAGVTVVIPKAHYPSDFIQLPWALRSQLGEFVAMVMERLIDGFDDVGRVGLAVEGYGIDHFHYKLYPLHGTPKDEWRQILSPPEAHEYVHNYRGYFATASGPRADDEQLAKLASRLRGEQS